MNLKERIYDRDKKRCVLCGHEAMLEIHHIKGREEAPELRSVDRNCVLLCHLCHRETHGHYCKKKKVSGRSLVKSIENQQRIDLYIERLYA